MNEPLQLSAPAGAQIHIHLGAAAAVTTHDGALLLPPPLQPPPSTSSSQPRRLHILKLTLAGLLLFAGGYVVRGIVSAPASGQSTSLAAATLQPAPFYPALPPSALAGSLPGGAMPTLPPSIHVTPATPYGVTGAAVPPETAAAPPLVPGSVTTSPPIAPPSPQAAGPAAPGRNPFGLD